MPETTTVKVSPRYQISLPGYSCHELNIQAGDRLLVDVQDGLLILVPEPDDYVSYLAGLHRKIWQGVDTITYLNEEREAWQTSVNGS